MENILEHKGYVGQFTYEEGDESFHGTVLGLRHVIHFQGNCVAQLKQSLRDSVDDYLQWCEQEGMTPERPYTGKFVVHVSPDLHRIISIKAQSAGMTINQWVAQALARETGSPADA